MSGMSEPAAASGAHRFCFWPSWPVPFGLDLARSPAEPCPYLEEREMRVRGFACDFVPGNACQRLLDAGFRRSGQVFYQPACDGCRQCVPLRVPVTELVPSRSQRRCSRRNRDLTIQVGTPVSTDEKHELFVRYLEATHDGAMSGDRPSFDDFLYSACTDTIEFTYRDPAARLIGLGICDLTPESVSTVYFAYDPAAHKRGLGTFSSLTEMEFARRTGRPYYYLGYWVGTCPKMAYKARFRPAEVLDGDGVWRPLTTALR